MTVPDGTVQDVLDWVGDDPERAQEALDAEQNGQQRTTLMAKLEAIASDEQEDTVSAPAGANDTLPPEGDIEDMAPAPEQPAEVIIDPNAEGTVVSPVHVRDGDVEVPGDADLTPTPTEGEEEVEPPEGEQVEYFQAVSSTGGGALAINGQVFIFSPQMVATLKMAVDKMIVGMSL